MPGGHRSSDGRRETAQSSLCDGSAYASTAFTEPATGSDPTLITTTAVPDGDDFIINGTKRYITGGNKKGYGVFYVKDGELKDQKGNITAIIVEKSSEGYSASEPWEFMGLEGMNCVDVFFKDVRVPQSNVLGDRGNGFKILLRWIAGERVAQAGYMVGVGQAALEGLNGIKNVEKGFRGFKEINTVTYDPAVITTEEMEAALKKARTYRGTAK